MNEFQPNTLFDLKEFPYAAIFDGISLVWEVLPKIEPFLTSLKLGIFEETIDSRVHLVDPELISIGKGSVIEPGVCIKGPCVIGQGCVIRHGAYIRGNVIIGNHCVIGHDTEVKNSLFLNEAKAPHFAFVGDSVLGNRVNLGAGTICANLRLDRKNVVIRYGKEKVTTNLHKMGAIFGDDAQTGCNTVTNPGTIFLKRAFCLPLQNVGGVVG